MKITITIAFASPPLQLCIHKTRKDRSKKKMVNGGKKENTPLISKALQNAKSPTVGQSKDNSKSGRLITIPLHVLSKIDTKAPFALKLNNETFKIDPSRLIKTATGVKIFIKNCQVVKPDIVPKPKVGYEQLQCSHTVTSRYVCSGSIFQYFQNIKLSSLLKKV